MHVDLEASAQIIESAWFKTVETKVSGRHVTN